MDSYEKIHEPISILTLFQSRPPVTKLYRFLWRDKVYRIDSIDLITKTHKGDDLVYLYSVSNDKGAYKLRFDTSTLHWWLEEIYWQ